MSCIMYSFDEYMTNSCFSLDWRYFVLDFEIPKMVQRMNEDIQKNQLRYHNRRVALTKSFTFDAAHHLHLYEGKCKNLHGHTYRLELTVSGHVNEIGIVIDFDELKSMYKDVIESRMDHRYLNAVLPPMNTTAENMIVWMWEELDRALQKDVYQDQGIRLEEISLFETPTSKATLKRAWMENNDDN